MSEQHAFDAYFFINEKDGKRIAAANPLDDVRYISFPRPDEAIARLSQKYTSYDIFEVSSGLKGFDKKFPTTCTFEQCNELARLMLKIGGRKLIRAAAKEKKMNMDGLIGYAQNMLDEVRQLRCIQAQNRKKAKENRDHGDR